MSYNEVTDTYHCDLCQEIVQEEDFQSAASIGEVKDLARHFCCDEHYELWLAAN